MTTLLFVLLLIPSETYAANGGAGRPLPIPEECRVWVVGGGLPQLAAVPPPTGAPPGTSIKTPEEIQIEHEAHKRREALWEWLRVIFMGIAGIVFAGLFILTINWATRRLAGEKLDG